MGFNSGFKGLNGRALKLISHLYIFYRGWECMELYLRPSVMSSYVVVNYFTAWWVVNDTGFKAETILCGTSEQKLKIKVMCKGRNIFKVLILPELEANWEKCVILQCNIWVIQGHRKRWTDWLKLKDNYANCSKVTPSPVRAHDSPPAWTSPQRLKVTQLKFPCQWRAPPLFKWSLILQ